MKMSKRRPTLGDKVRVIRERDNLPLYDSPLTIGAEGTIVVDHMDFLPYKLDIHDGWWLAESQVELIELEAGPFGEDLLD